MQGANDARNAVFSFVLPAFNEEANLRAMAERLKQVGEQLGEPFEIVWVNDGSWDSTETILEELAREDSRIRPLHFSRNFGHMAALTAGFEAARASGAVVCLDSDGQHPVELIPRMVELWRKGADIVQTVRSHGPGLSFTKRITSKGFYRVMNFLGDLDLPAGAADFRLMDREVVNALNGLPERVRFMRGLVYWVGFRRELLPYEALPRLGGETKYGLLSMVRLALGGITSFSMRPLRLSTLMGTTVTVLAAVYGAYILVCYFLGIPLTPGWTSMLLLIMLLGGAQLIAIGIASEYLGRMFIEQKQRPVYIIRKQRAAHRCAVSSSAGVEKRSPQFHETVGADAHEGESDTT